MINSQWLTALALSVMMTGCATVGPDYQRPGQVGSVSLTESNSSEGSSQQSSYLPAQQALSWWRHFDDPELTRLVSLGLEQNRTLDKAEANVSRAFAVFRESGAEQRPSGDLGAEYRASRNPTSAEEDDDTLVRSYQGGLSLSWDLDLVGKLRRASESAAAEADQALALWREAQIEIISQVATSYGEYRAAQSRLQVARRNLHSLDQTRSIIDARRDAGMVSDLELARVDAQLYELQSQIPAYRLAMSQAQATLAALLGQAPGQLLLADSEGLPQLNRPLSIQNDSHYLRYRPDVAAAERALAARTADIGVATADLYPQVSFNGFLGFLSGDSNFISSDQRAWSVVPAINWQVLNRLSVRSRIAAAQASQQMALADFEQAVFDALAEMQVSLDGYNYSRQQLVLYQRQVQHMEKAVTIARARYESGTGEFLELLDAERELLDVRDGLVQLQQRNFNQLVAVYQSFAGAVEV